jgi:hypothetical protein
MRESAADVKLVASERCRAAWNELSAPPGKHLTILASGHETMPATAAMGDLPVGPIRCTLDVNRKERSEMRFFGRDNPADQAPPSPTDEQAVARYRYMLATAPPEEIEKAHEEAFARLTPDQRRQALEALAQHVPEGEIRGDDPASLARTATRAEIRQPGTIERAWGGPAGSGLGLGGMFLTMVAGSFIGTAIAQSFFDNDAGYDGSTANDDGGASDPDGSEGGEANDLGGDSGAADAGDMGGGDFGGDMGGGDFGGGDFGGF